MQWSRFSGFTLVFRPKALNLTYGKLGSLVRHWLQGALRGGEMKRSIISKIYCYQTTLVFLKVVAPNLLFPAWALWQRIKEVKTKWKEGSKQDANTVGGIIDEVLSNSKNGLSGNGKAALVIDDDLSSDTQDKLAQFIRIVA